MTSQVPPNFDREEYEKRLQVVREAMRRTDADILIVDQREHLAYLTGFGPSATMYQCCIVPLNADPIMVLRRLDGPTFLESTWLTHHVMYADTDDPTEVLVETLTEHGLSGARIAFELDSNYLPVSQFNKISAALPEATFIDFSGIIRDIRLIKSPSEIEHLRRASSIADTAMERAISTVSEGTSERVVASTASRSFLELGADSGHVGPVASGNRTDSLHGSLGDHRLSKGDIIHLELCPSVGGYSARLMRPAVIGPSSSEQQKVARLLIDIQDEQLAAMRPGVVAKDVDKIMRHGVLDADLRDTYDNTTGYTLGYYGPTPATRSSDFTRIFTPYSEWTLEPGMVFHMYTSARGMAFSETVLVTPTGSERLTRTERKLFVC